jgi:hypothetical protein
MAASGKTDLIPASMQLPQSSAAAKGAMGAGSALSNSTLVMQRAGAPNSSVVGHVAPAKTVENDPDANVSLGILDDYLLGAAAEGVLGSTQWTVMRELLRGMRGGLQSVPPEQQARIEAKFAVIGVSESLDYTAGYGLGIVEGLWLGLKGLGDAVVTLVTLPYEVNRFLMVKAPELAVQYGPRLLQFLSEGEGLSARLTDALSDILKDPIAALRAFDMLIEDIKGSALAQVRALGHGLAAQLLDLIEEPWFDFGRDLGKVVGQILFEVILALASDAIANVAKQVLSLAARLSARLLEGAVELFRTIRRLLGNVIAWFGKLVSRLTGKLGEVFKELKTFISRFDTLLEDLAVAGDTGTGFRMPIPDSPRPPMVASRAVKPARGTSGPKASKGSVKGSHTGSPTFQYRDNLVKRYPRLANAELTPINRSVGEAGLWEESVYTGSGKQSWSGKMRDGANIQLDDIDAAGVVIDTKMRGIDVGREIPPAHIPDVVEQVAGARASRSFEAFPEKGQAQLLKQLRFSKENGLKGVRWETNSAELQTAVERYAETMLTGEEQKLFEIILVQR